MEDDKGRDTILDLVPKARDLRLLPIGRMERDATGIIIMTNEIGWIHPLTHPSFQHIRRYEVVVSGIPTEESLIVLRNGVKLVDDDRPCSPCKVKVLDVDSRAGLALLDMEIEESKPSQVQRMMQSVEHEVISIKRTQFGPIQLKGLRKAQWRELSKDEVDKLKMSCTKLDAPVKQTSVGDDRTKRGSSRRRQPRRPGAGYAARQPLVNKQDT